MTDTTANDQAPPASLEPPPAANPDPPTRIDVGGESPYAVLVGRGLLDHLPPLLPGADRVAVVAPAPVAWIAEAVATALSAAGRDVLELSIPDAEAGKTVEVAAGCWDALGRAGFTRSDAVVGVGGGAATDLAGFVAAGWLRGVRWVPVATSLLGMVDAAIGGKTGINTGAGKNLVGAFHPPAGVIVDLDCLVTLPRVELVGGLAEVVKYGFIADPTILDLIEADPAGASDPYGAALPELVRRCVKVKAAVVSVDLKESGPREVLNYGHTLGHAIERAQGYGWRHGHAVAVGMVYAAALARRMGRLDEATQARHRDVLQLLGLPVEYPDADAFPELLSTMRIDKKSRGARLRFVVLDGLAQPSILDSPPEDVLAEVFREIS